MTVAERELTAAWRAVANAKLTEDAGRSVGP